MKKISKIMMSMLIFCIISPFVMCMSRSEKNREMEKIEKKVKKINADLGNYFEKIIMLDESYGRVPEKTEVKYYIGNDGQIKKIITRTYVEDSRAYAVTEYYLEKHDSEDYYPCLWSNTFVTPDGKKISEIKFYYTGTDLFRIVDNGKTDDGENDEYFGRGTLRGYSSVMQLIQEDADGTEEGYEEEY